MNHDQLLAPDPEEGRPMLLEEIFRGRSGRIDNEYLVDLKEIRQRAERIDYDQKRGFLTIKLRDDLEWKKPLLRSPNDTYTIYLGRPGSTLDLETFLYSCSAIGVIEHVPTKTKRDIERSLRKLAGE